MRFSFWLKFKARTWLWIINFWTDHRINLFLPCLFDQTKKTTKKKGFYRKNIYMAATICFNYPCENNESNWYLKYRFKILLTFKLRKIRNEQKKNSFGQIRSGDLNTWDTIQFASDAYIIHATLEINENHFLEHMWGWLAFQKEFNNYALYIFVASSVR